MENSTNPTRSAVPILKVARTHAEISRCDVTVATAALTGARRARAVELADMLADCVAFADRLVFALRAEEASDAHQAVVLDDSAARRRGVQL